MDIIKEIREKLVSMADEKYRSFHLPLIPSADPESVIGIRTPKLRQYAKELCARADRDLFLDDLPHRFYEENNLHAFIIEREKDFLRCVGLVDKFLPHIDNWATCDCLSPKVFKKHPDELLKKAHEWISSSHTYTVRFGIKCLMSFFLDEHFSPEILSIVADIKSEEYYVNMMRAWFFATALAKQYDSTLPLLTGNRLDLWTHNKTIRKAIESYRITNEQKSLLRTLTVK